MNINELTDYTAELLQIARFKDYCPNGLQVSGRTEIKKIVSGVTASMALLKAAQAANADAILVHHGYFWKSEDSRVIGLKRERIKFLLEHDLNLLAYHLPLDAHTALGNNAQLGDLMQINIKQWGGEQNIVAMGELNNAQELNFFANTLSEKLLRKTLVIGELTKSVKQIAWCTGAAQQYIEVAVEMGADVFISGEISEQTVHIARESGVAYIAAGHHATERYGVQALGQHLAQKFGIKHQYIDIDNPV